MGSLHHVQLCCGNVSPLLHLLVKGLGFRTVAARHTPLAQHWVLRSGRATFLLSQKNENFCPVSPDGVAADAQFVRGEPWSVFCCGAARHRRDSAFNVALRVRNVSSVVERAVRAGGRVLQPPVSVHAGGREGRVEFAVVAPPVDGYVHTLVDTSRYTGVFLPGFEPVCCTQQQQQRVEFDSSVMSDTSCCDTESAAPQYMDHVAIACDGGQGAMLQRWYEHVLGARRFCLNTADTQSGGLQFGGNVQMALRALRYTVDSEDVNNPSSVHVNDPSSAQVNDTVSGEICDQAYDCDYSSALKLVLAESLDDSSHVAAFLREHGAPGVQHVGLHSPAALRCVRRLVTHGGAALRVPPAGYYRRAAVRQLMAEVGLTAEQQRECERLGLLVDSEEDGDVEQRLAGDRYLMQVFTKPIFSESTFFLEVIERRGARGFGQGNIEALASSIVEPTGGEEVKGADGDHDELDLISQFNGLANDETNTSKLQQKSR